jgi:hypothetical protein
MAVIRETGARLPSGDTALYCGCAALYWNETSSKVRLQKMRELSFFCALDLKDVTISSHLGNTLQIVRYLPVYHALYKKE